MAASTACDWTRAGGRRTRRRSRGRTSSSTTATINYSDLKNYMVKWTKGWEDDCYAERDPPRNLSVLKNRTYDLPDGAKLITDTDGNYRIDDADAKVTYRANRNRDFSPHLNASDMLAQFVRYVGSLGVRQDEVLGLPIELFINWLIIEAAERDQDPLPPEVVPIERRLIEVVKPRCLSCGRFIPRLHQRHRFQFCHPQHAVIYARRLSQKRIAATAAAV